MSKLTWVVAAVARALAWLLPAEGRDWAEAAWAEAHAVPQGLTRLAWRAGGMWVLAREALRPGRLGRAALFAALANGTAAMFTTTLGTGLTLLMFFPVIGLMMSYLAAVIANPVPRLPEIRSSGPGLSTTYGEGTA